MQRGVALVVGQVKVGTEVTQHLSIKIKTVRFTSTRFAWGVFAARENPYPDYLLVPPHRGNMQSSLALRVCPVSDVLITVVV